MRAIGILACVALLVAGGCPQSTSTETIQGGDGSGTKSLIQGEASVTVLTPTIGLPPITGGTQVEVNWKASGRTKAALLDVFLDVDNDPNNGNEIILFADVPLQDTQRLIDTTLLNSGVYKIGVRLRELGNIGAFGYAPGNLTINQAPRFRFTSAHQNVTYDRSSRITPHITVSWELTDPDPTDLVNVYLDPDNLPNANEILLFKAASRSETSFSFDLPTSALAAGTYRILALVTNGVQNNTPFYMPGTIRLRSRLSGYVDLRDLNEPNAPVGGAIFEGFNPRDNLGSFVGGAADIDGDGFHDFLMVSQFGKPGMSANIERTGVGEAYMVYGRQRRFAGVNNVNSTGVLFRGEIFMGVPEASDPLRPSRGITSFDVIGDWDGDGTRELCFGVPYTDSVNQLELFDNDGAFRSGGVIIAAGASLLPSLGFPGGRPFDLAGFGQWDTAPQPPSDRVCPEGFVGANSPGFNFYKHMGFFANWPLGGTTALEAEPWGCRVHTDDWDDQCGETVSAYPFNALIISVPNRDPIANTAVGRSIPGAGVVSLWYGSFLWDVTSNVLPHYGPYRYILDDNRIVVTPAGPNIASPGYWTDIDDATNPCDRWTDATGERGTPSPVHTVRYYGTMAGARVGNGMRAGDINADGLEDILIGSPQSDEGAGSTFIVFGRLPALIRSHELALEELTLPMNAADPNQQRIFDGIRILGGPGDHIGTSHAPAGDFNNDGVPDILIGSPLVNNHQGGAAMIFGSRDLINLTQRDIPYDEIDSRGLGVIFEGEAPGDLAGARVAAAGDVDRDGNADILIAAPGRSVKLDANGDGIYEIDRTNCGVVYLIYGSPNLRGRYSLADVGTEKLPGVVFIGRYSDYQLGGSLGELGDRGLGIAGIGDVDGDGHADLMLSSSSANPRDRARAGEAYLIYGTGD